MGGIQSVSSDLIGIETEGGSYRIYETDEVKEVGDLVIIAHSDPYEQVEGRADSGRSVEIDARALLDLVRFFEIPENRKRLEEEAQEAKDAFQNKLKETGVLSFPEVKKGARLVITPFLKEFQLLDGSGDADSKFKERLLRALKELPPSGSEPRFKHEVSDIEKAVTNWTIGLALKRILKVAADEGVVLD
jgi:hypothetical protein